LRCFHRRLIILVLVFVRITGSRSVIGALGCPSASFVSHSLVDVSVTPPWRRGTRH
uniref:Transglut_core3 domain-containing protein n=1 Tax=Taenia asiatica TaxID=60517 RepID=A0A0R3WEG1_TAEAS